MIILASGRPAEAALYWRSMGVGEFVAVPLKHVTRGVYKVALTADEVAAGDLEYYLKLVSAKGKAVYFPATAPSISQTVVVTKLEH